jgi:hypothetical protein
MANHNTDNSVARNHIRVADESVADVDLVASNPRYIAGDPRTHKLPRMLAVGGAGNLVVRYEGMGADADALIFGGASGLALGIPFPMAPAKIESTGSTATNVFVWW